MKTNRIMRMKKHLTQLLLSLLFLVVTAMTCDEQDWVEPIDVPLYFERSGVISLG